MNNKFNEYSEDDKYDIKTISAKEAVSHDPTDIEIAENTEMFLSPFDREQSKYFFRIEAKSFQDIQLLGFIPRGLAEEKIKQAILKDDEQVHKISEKMMDQMVIKKCSCGDHEESRSGISNTYGSNLRQTYTSIRKSYHPELATLLSEHLQTKIEWDNPLAGIVKKWATTVNVNIILSVFKDITINKGATLLVDRTVQNLWAGAILIHRTGRLVNQGGYLKIWANNLSSFSDFSKSVYATKALEKLPWKFIN